MNIFKIILFPFSFLFYVLVWCKNKLYDLGILRIHKVSIPVISVGNIMVGGSGKTPYILKLIDLLKENGKTPGVIYRGYKRIGKEEVAKVDIDVAAKQFGDEASLVAFTKKVPVYVGKDRYQVAKQMLAKEKVDVILMDDAFQHRRMHRDVDLVVLDATDARYSYFMMPMGRAREPMSSLKRANLIALHKVNLVKDIKPMTVPHIRSSIVFRGLVSMSHWLEGKDVYSVPKENQISLICGVAKPLQVLETLKKEYPKLNIHLHAFSDHHSFAASDLPKGPFIITEKDAIKIKDLSMDHSQTYVMKTDIEGDFSYEIIAAKIFTS